MLLNGNVVDADDVRNGAKVKVSYFERAGIKIARDVMVTDATPARSYGRTGTRDNR